jgi:CBS domain-containing protein
MDSYLVQEIMHRGLITCLPTTTLDTIGRRMIECNVHALIVVDAAGYAIGLVSQVDLVLAHQRLALGDAPATAQDVMTTSLITCTPDTPVAEAIAIMARHHIHRLLVVKPHTPNVYPIGVISMTDIIRHINWKRANAGRPKFSSS